MTPPVAAQSPATQEERSDVSAASEDRARSGNTVAESDVTRMFDSIAGVYDRMNTLMTLGTDARWRERACLAAEIEAGDSALDAACGTGKLAALLAETVGPFGRVEAVDLSPAMIDEAARRYRSLVQLEFSVANVLELPFEDDRFDAATIGFGLRNLADFERGFRELARVVKPGGRVVCLELSLPRSRAWARLFHGAFRRAAPLAARLAGARESAYEYLPNSLDGFPRPERLAAIMRTAGLVDVRFWRLSTGVVALHRGYVPARRDEA